MTKGWAILSMCQHPSIIENIYDHKFPLKGFNKMDAELIKRLNDAKTDQVLPTELLYNFRLYDYDCREGVLEKITKYKTTSFKVIMPDKFRRMAIPEDKKFLVALDDDWKGVYIRAKYAHGIVTFDELHNSKLVLNDFKIPKNDINLAHTYQDVLADRDLIKSFVK